MIFLFKMQEDFKNQSIIKNLIFPNQNILTILNIKLNKKIFNFNKFIRKKYFSNINNTYYKTLMFVLLQLKICKIILLVLFLLKVIKSI